MQVIQLKRKLQKNTHCFLVQNNETIHTNYYLYNTYEIDHLSINSGALFIHINPPIDNNENTCPYISLNDIIKIINSDTYIFVISKYLHNMDYSIQKIIVNSDNYLEIY